MSGIMPKGAPAEWRAHWPVVLAAFAGMGLSTIAAYTISLFIEPIEAEFGWSRAQIMSGNLFAAIIGVTCAPLIGAAVDKYGPRRFGIAAIIHQAWRWLGRRWQRWWRRHGWW